MSPALLTLVVAGSVVAGAFGALLGLGGGIVVVPLLTALVYTDSSDVRRAIGASLVAVVATSSGAAARYLRGNVANLRVGVLLEPATCAGALVGAELAGVAPQRLLFFLFAAALVYAAATVARRGRAALVEDAPPDALADRLKLHGRYFDAAEGRVVEYRVARPRAGLAVSALAGVQSGLLGVGGGVLKVPAMHALMNLPMKAATATSNVMVGVTAAAGACVYLRRGEVDPLVAAPVAAGVLVGAQLGVRLAERVRSATVTRVFVVLLVAIALQVAWRGTR